MITTPFLLISIFLLSSTLIPSSVSEKCNPYDKTALLKIKQDFGNPYVLASWNPSTDCCDWYCVTCDELKSNRITELFVVKGSLPGKIPASIGNLPFLETLRLHKQANLTGPIQPAIAKLKNLKFLEISWTNVSGSVPNFLGNFKNLTSLDLSFNNLSGSIPSSLSKLRNINALHLDRNNLTGSIPESFGKFQGTVPSLYLSHNKLSGKIPKSLGNLDYNTIDFSRNQLEGDASMLFGTSKTTWQVDLSRNLLEFNLSTVKLPSSLGLLDLNHNKIFGSIPEQWTELNSSINLQAFNVSYNRLCGQIPVGGKLQNYDSTAYFHNKCLCGAPLENCK